MTVMMRSSGGRLSVEPVGAKVRVVGERAKEPPVETSIKYGVELGGVR